MLTYEIVEWGKPLVKTEGDTPTPQGSEVLLKLKYCGVCHSDAHIRDGYFNLGGGKRLRMSERGMNLPATLGHEPYGTVLAAGPEAGDAPIGLERLVYPWTGCGMCVHCRRGADNYCASPRYIGIHRKGGYADHLLVPHPRYLIDPGAIDPVWAATLSCSGLSGYSAVSRLGRIPPDEWVAVMGAGGLGLSAISILLALGHQRVVAVDLDDAKLAAAEAAGAAATVDCRESNAASQLQRIAGGALYGAIDMVGSTDTTRLALDALRKGGYLVLVGLYGGELALSLVTTIMRALTIRGSHLGSLTELKAVVALAQAGKLRPIPLQKRPLDAVDRTLDELKKGGIIGRVVAEI